MLVNAVVVIVAVVYTVFFSPVWKTGDRVHMEAFIK